MANPNDLAYAGGYFGMVPGSAINVPPTAPKPVPPAMTANLNNPLGLTMTPGAPAPANPVQQAVIQARATPAVGPVAGFVPAAPAAPPPAAAAPAPAPSVDGAKGNEQALPPGVPTIASTVKPAADGTTPGATPLPPGTPGGGDPGGTAMPMGQMVGQNAQIFVPGNPMSAIQAGFDRQFDTARQWRDEALDYVNQGTNIFERATRARAITGITNAVLGPNNQGAAAAQGTDAFNSAMAALGAAQMSAGASTNAQEHEDTRVAKQVAVEREKLYGTLQPAGQESYQTPAGLPVTNITYNRAVPPKTPGGMPTFEVAGPAAQREAASKPPAFDQWQTDAKKVNPGMSVEDLKKNYTAKYGVQPQ